MPRPASRAPRLAALACLGLLVAAAPAPAQERPRPRVVVAVVDTAVNPYHEFFHAGGSLYGSTAPSSVTPSVLAEFGIGKDNIISLTRTGNFGPDFAKDRAEFDAIDRGEPYWFEGTNVIGISFNPDDKQRLRPDGGASSHGVGTTAAVLQANPEAIVVSVESPGAALGVPGHATRPQGEAWAFSHPAVDIVTTSYGPQGSPPLGYHLTDAYEGVVERGKIHTGAADNSPALSPFDATSGPWFSIGVAGFGEGSTEGRTMTSGSLPDFVADFTQSLPYCRNCESGKSSVSGTSFATPRTAGTISKILLEARRAADHIGGIVTKNVARPLAVAGKGFSLTNWQVRRALEEAAYYPTTDEWSGSGDVPVNDAAPWLQVGWGAVTPDPAHKVVAEALARLGVAGTPNRAKDDAACAFMTANIEVRHAWWDRAAPFSQSNGSTSDPYRYC